MPKVCLTCSKSLFLTFIFVQSVYQSQKKAQYVILKVHVKVFSPFSTLIHGPVRPRALFNYQPNALWHVPIAAHQRSWQVREKPHWAWQPLRTCAPSPWQAQKTPRLPPVMINGFADCCSWPSRHIHNLLLAYSPDVCRGRKEDPAIFWLWHNTRKELLFKTFNIKCITQSN